MATESEDEGPRVKVIGVSVTQRDLDRVNAFRRQCAALLEREPAEGTAILALMRKGLTVVEGES